MRSYYCLHCCDFPKRLNPAERPLALQAHVSAPTRRGYELSRQKRPMAYHHFTKLWTTSNLSLPILSLGKIYIIGSQKKNVEPELGFEPEIRGSNPGSGSNFSLEI